MLNENIQKVTEVKKEKVKHQLYSFYGRELYEAYLSVDLLHLVVNTLFDEIENNKVDRHIDIYEYIYLSCLIVHSISKRFFTKLGTLEFYSWYEIAIEDTKEAIMAVCDKIRMNIDKILDSEKTAYRPYYIKGVFDVNKSMYHDHKPL